MLAQQRQMMLKEFPEVVGARVFQKKKVRRSLTEILLYCHVPSLNSDQ